MNGRRSVLLVDDDDAHRHMLAALLGDLGVDIALAADGNEALQAMSVRVPDLVLLDMRMPGMDGLATLAAMRERQLRSTVVVLTAHADLDDAVRAMKLGAADYLKKPIDIASLQALLHSHLGPPALAGDLPPLPPDVVAVSPLVRDVCRDLARIAGSDAAVLLHGETGTGKEVFADLLHRWSPRARGPLVAVNMAAIPEALVESELFGHKKGAFTGAEGTRRGRFQEAAGGTLFLDEIGEMPLAVQPKLLRVLQSRRVAAVGDSREEALDFRLVAASNRDLEAEVAANRFRQDLYYRVAVITVEIPPLRERPEDILPMAEQFLLQAGAGRKRLSPATQLLLQQYAWPGNVRELQNTMLRAAVLAAGDVVLPDNLPPSLRAAVASAPVPASDLSLAAAERRAIESALDRTHGNRSEAARLLGISRRKLLYRLEEYRNGAPPA